MINRGSQPYPFCIALRLFKFFIFFSIISIAKTLNDNYEATTIIDNNNDNDDGKGNSLLFTFYYFIFLFPGFNRLFRVI